MILKMNIFQIVRLNELDNYFANIDSININILNKYSENLLHQTGTNNCIEIAKDLISKGINVNQRGYKGSTPLQYLLEGKHSILIRMVIEAGADVNIRDNYGNNALWTATFNARGDYEFVELILEKGGEAFTKNKAGRSPLDLANQFNDKILIDLLTASNPQK